MSFKELKKSRCRLKRPIDEDFLNEWTDDFEKLLNDKVGIRLFAEFLKKEFSYENLKFWISCQRYKRLTNKEALKSEAMTIYYKYLSIDASEAVNVDTIARHEVEKGLENPTKHLFSLPEKQIYDLMKFDCYKRFLESNICNNLIVRDFYKRQLRKRNRRQALKSKNQPLVSPEKVCLHSNRDDLCKTNVGFADKCQESLAQTQNQFFEENYNLINNFVESEKNCLKRRPMNRLSNFLKESEVSFSDDKKSEELLNRIMLSSQMMPINQNMFSLSPKLIEQKSNNFFIKTQNNNKKENNSKKSQISKVDKEIIPKVYDLNQIKREKSYAKNEKLFKSFHKSSINSKVKSNNSENLCYFELNNKNNTNCLPNIESNKPMQTLAKFHKTSKTLLKT